MLGFLRWRSEAGAGGMLQQITAATTEERKIESYFSRISFVMNISNTYKKCHRERVGANMKDTWNSELALRPLLNTWRHRECLSLGRSESESGGRGHLALLFHLHLARHLQHSLVSELVHTASMKIVPMVPSDAALELGRRENGGDTGCRE